MNEIEDIEKAEWYLRKLIELESNVNEVRNG
jgi:hypothetical protein